MAPPSSGGSTVGEALNILENVDLGAMYRADRTRRCTTTSRRARWRSPTAASTSAPRRRCSPASSASCSRRASRDERFCALDQTKAATKPVPAGHAGRELRPTCDARRDDHGAAAGDHEGLSTSHLTVADRWGNIVTYTLTIEQTGGSALTVPGRGFLLNNELTDFDLAPTSADVPTRTRPAPGKRPAVVDVADDRHGPRSTAGRCSPPARRAARRSSPPCCRCCSTRSTSGCRLPQAVAAPRASQRNTKDVQAEPAFDRAGLAGVRAHLRRPAGTGRDRRRHRHRARATAGWSRSPSRCAAAAATRGWCVRAAEPARSDPRGVAVVRQGPRHGERLRAAARPRRRAVDLTRRAGRRRSATGGPASAATGCCGSCAPRRDPEARALPGRGRPGSWTTATPTARSPRCAATACGCSRATSSTRGSPSRASSRSLTRGGVKDGPARCDGRRHRRHGDGRRSRPAQAQLEVRVDGRCWPAAGVDMGNPHAVVFVDDR